MEVYFKDFKKLVLEFHNCKITTQKMRLRKKLTEIFNDGKFHSYYEEYKSEHPEPEITTDMELTFNMDLKLNYTNNPIFYFLIFAYDEKFYSFVEKYVTSNMINIAYLFACEKGIQIHLFNLDDCSQEYLILVFLIVLEKKNQEMIDYLIKLKIDELLGPEIFIEGAQMACTNGCLTDLFLKKILSLGENLDALFMDYDIYESQDVLIQFLSSSCISQEAKDQKFEESNINSEAAKLFIKHDISGDVFERVFLRKCESSEDLIGITEERIKIDGIIYKPGDEIQYFTKLPKDHILSRFIESKMMTEHTFNLGLAKLDIRFIYLPALLAYPLANKHTISEFCKDKILKEYYEQAKEERVQEETVLEQELIQEIDETMAGPHDRCNYLDPEKLIIIGASPRQEDIERIIEDGVRLFINLTEKKDYVLPDDIFYYNFPIKSGMAPSQKKMKEISELVIEAYNEGIKMYIHCTGGHGRASVIAACVIGKMMNMDAPDAIQYVEDCRNSRVDQSRNFIPVPETQKQVEFIGKILGVGGNKKLPDRSDNSWLQRVKKERIER